jgi:hypothetical protein
MAASYVLYQVSVEEDDDDFIVSVPAPEFEEAAAPTPKDGEGNKTKAEKVRQLFTNDDAHKNTQSGGATGTDLK